MAVLPAGFSRRLRCGAVCAQQQQTQHLKYRFNIHVFRFAFSKPSDLRHGCSLHYREGKGGDIFIHPRGVIHLYILQHHFCLPEGSGFTTCRREVAVDKIAATPPVQDPFSNRRPRDGIHLNTELAYCNPEASRSFPVAPVVCRGENHILPCTCDLGFYDEVKAFLEVDPSILSPKRSDRSRSGWGYIRTHSVARLWIAVMTRHLITHVIGKISCQR